MKIGIDCRMLGSGFGLARYVQQLVKHLMEIDHENDYVLFLCKENYDAIKFPPLLGEGQGGVLDPDLNVSIGNVVCRNSKSTSTRFKKVLADIPWYSWQEQIKFSKIIKKEKVDLMHFPHFNVPLFYNKPFVVTIHDLTMYHFPRPEATTRSKFVFWLKDKIHRLVIRRAVKKAKKIFVTSEFTKNDIHETLGVDLSKMVVTYQAPFESQKSKVSLQGSKEGKSQKSILEKYNINKPFVLYVGAAYPHKNLEGLLKAWQIFEEKYSRDYQLVLVGKKNYFYDRLLDNKTIRQLDNVIYTDFVEDSELVELYRNTNLYVFPSLYEGFGLPPLEAMSYGVPVASSNSTCLPEVLGEGAIYFDPENYEQMAETIYRGLVDKDLRYELINNGKEVLKRYSWEKLVVATKGEYRI